MLLALMLACNGDNEDSGFWEPGDDTGEPAETCADDDACAAYEICNEDSVCETGDRNNSLEEAESLAYESEVKRYLQQSGDSDWFTFQGEGGDFIRIHTAWAGGGEEADAPINTIVTLRNPAGKVHTVEDEHPLGNVTTYDTVMYSYIPEGADGTWSIEVTDVEGRGATTGAYTIELLTTGRHTDEEDSESDPSYELEMEDGYLYAVGAVLEEDGDSDWIELSLPYDDCPVLFYGNSFQSGSALEPVIELSVDGELYMRKQQPNADNGAGMYFEIDGGSALVSISDPDGEGSADHWTWLYVRVLERGYSYTQETEDNSTSDVANVLDVEWDGTEGLSRAWGVMDEAGDEDWFLVTVDEGYNLVVDGTADALGSLLDAEVEVLDSEGNVLAVGEADEDQFGDTESVGPLAAGDYYVRVFSAASSDVGPAYYYRFSAYQIP